MVGLHGTRTVAGRPAGPTILVVLVLVLVLVVGCGPITAPWWWWWLQHPSKDDEACAISGKRTTSNSKLNTVLPFGVYYRTVPYDYLIPAILVLIPKQIPAVPHSYEYRTPVKKSTSTPVVPLVVQRVVPDYMQGL